MQTNEPSWDVPTGRRDGLPHDRNIGLPVLQLQAIQLHKHDGQQSQPVNHPILPFPAPIALPPRGDSSRRVTLDTGSPDRFDSSFFTNLRNGCGILDSDQKLWTEPTTRAFLQQFLAFGGPSGLNFNAEFGQAMIKMSNIGIETRADGEIRKICSTINKFQIAGY
ncbi:hypothetical protein CRG98_014700 [Punica granatum]|uniref:peroxidase n=1 Tax=Punica granatum TaxID=22663 RepID=A0A2I0K8Q4_PUNGR|nr:hypothetical protein CRG98_014700 [Punica granatum]